MSDNQLIKMPPAYAARIAKRDEERRIWQAERVRWILRHDRYHAELMQAKAQWQASGDTWREWLAIKRDIKDRQRDEEAYQIGRDLLIREGKAPDTAEGQTEAWKRGFHLMALRMAKKMGG